MSASIQNIQYKGVPITISSPITASVAVVVGNIVARNAAGTLLAVVDDTAGQVILGIAHESYDNTAVAATGKRIDHSYYPVAWLDVGTGTIARTDVDTLCYPHTDNSVRKGGDGAGTTNCVVGKIIDVNDETTATRVLVDFRVKS